MYENATLAQASEATDYWLQRLAQAVDMAARAHTERTRAAYLDLANHYWSMHVMISGNERAVELPFPGREISSPMQTIVARRQMQHAA